MKTTLRILVVEDSEDDALLELHLIKKAGFSVEYERVETAEEMKKLLKESTWDIILSDYAMPHFNGLEALSILKKSGIDIPFIIISGTIGEEVAVEALQAGAHDYLMKNNLKRLLPAIERELREADNRAEHKLLEQKQKLAEEALIESEERFRLIAENTADTIAVLDLDLNFKYISPSVYKLRGYTIEESLEQTFDQVFTPASLLKVKKVYADQMTLEENGNADPSRTILLELEEYHKDGSTIWVEVSISIIRDFNSKPRQILTATRDITLRRKAVEELRILSRAVEQSPASIVITDIEGNIKYINSKFTEITGYTLEEAFRQNPRILKSGEMSPDHYKDLWHTITSGNEWTGEFHNKKKSGELYWERASLSPIYNEHGDITHFLAIKEDITEKKQLIDNLILAKNKAEESDRLKSAFLANMSHEIRTPMNGILGFSELLKMPGLSGEQQQEYIKIIEKSGARMLNIINDIVEISKIESGIAKVNLTETQINQQTQQVYKTFKTQAEDKGIQITLLNGLPTDESLVITDRDKVNSVLTNLVKNAIKFTFHGSIEFGYNLKNNELEFFVKDTGIGIPNDRQKAIFDRFVQADIADSRAFQGAGLGLSISKAFVEMLGGKIWVESESGNGSTFYFTIPHTTKSSNEISSETNIASNETAINLPRKLKILITDDDEVSSILMSIAFKKFSSEQIKAISGIQSIEICRNNPDIDLIMMDLKMPGMDGYEATRQIRKFNKKVIIIAQTAFALSGDREKALAAGCNDYIPKPLNLDSLKLLIQKHF
jgi:PAS domain S-box-containing protein